MKCNKCGQEIKGSSAFHVCTVWAPGTALGPPLNGYYNATAYTTHNAIFELHRINDAFEYASKLKEHGYIVEMNMKYKELILFNRWKLIISKIKIVVVYYKKNYDPTKDTKKEN